jgi:hypothetical protein
MLAALTCHGIFLTRPRTATTSVTASSTSVSASGSVTTAHKYGTDEDAAVSIAAPHACFSCIRHDEVQDAFGGGYEDFDETVLDLVHCDFRNSQARSRRYLVTEIAEWERRVQGFALTRDEVIARRAAMQHVCNSVCTSTAL